MRPPPSLRPLATLATAAALALAAGCGAPATATSQDERRGETNGTAFELTTGGSTLTDESGSWTVRVRGDAMWVATFKDGKSRELGTYQLSGRETQKLWGYIDKASLTRFPEGRDFGPKVPVFSFTLLRPKKLSYTTNVSSQAAANDDRLDDLVSYVESLVRKYTREQAFFWPE